MSETSAASTPAFQDCRGDVAFFAKSYAKIRRLGREDDLLVLKFQKAESGDSVNGSS